jgi:glutathione synthase/RimK-type ligase-like ATP-grasp enzyme
MSSFRCLWNPESPRAAAFSKAVRVRGNGRLRAVAWADFLAGQQMPEADRNSIVRIESPGRNWKVEKLLLLRGAKVMNDARYESYSLEEVESLEDVPGRVTASRQHYLGFVDALQMLLRHFESMNARWMLHPGDIATMCDKEACQARLKSAGVRVPDTLGVPVGFDDLMARMDAAGRHRVFLKLCHGSSASGTVALERSAGRMQAFSTAIIKQDDTTGCVVLHNRRGVTKYDDLRVIRTLVDAVCRHRAHAEAWVPKAGWRGRRFDVRIVVIAGRACHIVARLAQGPFTNLQFGAARGTPEELREHVGAKAFGLMCEEAERAMACFPRSLYAGLDVMLDAREHRTHVLEVNAFGDLLPGIRHQGRETYAAEIEAALDRDHVSKTGA